MVSARGKSCRAPSPWRSKPDEHGNTHRCPRSNIHARPDLRRPNRGECQRDETPVAGCRVGPSRGLPPCPQAACATSTPAAPIVSPRRGRGGPAPRSASRAGVFRGANAKLLSAGNGRAQPQARQSMSRSDADNTQTPRNPTARASPQHTTGRVNITSGKRPSIVWILRTNCRGGSASDRRAAGLSGLPRRSRRAAACRGPLGAVQRARPRGQLSRAAKVRPTPEGVGGRRGNGGRSMVRHGTPCGWKQNGLPAARGAQGDADEECRPRPPPGCGDVGARCARSRVATADAPRPKPWSLRASLGEAMPKDDAG